MHKSSRGLSHRSPSSGASGRPVRAFLRPGILATNSHVIDGELITNLEVLFPSAAEGQKGPFKTALISKDPKRDLAFLKVQTDLPPLEIAGSYVCQKGDDVLVIGNPGVGGKMVLENAASRGVMSTKAVIGDQHFYQLGIAINSIPRRACRWPSSTKRRLPRTSRTRP